MKTKITQAIALSLCLSAAGATNLATAGTIVTQWQFEATSVFGTNNNAYSIPTFGSGNGSQTVNESEISWGDTGGSFQGNNADRSAITIGSATATGVVNDANGLTVNTTGGGSSTGYVNTFTGGTGPSVANGQIGFGSNFTHWNNSLNGNRATLTGATIFDTLKLTPYLPNAGAAVSLPNLTFDFKFNETSNSSGTCIAGPQNTSNPCPDIWGFAGVDTSSIGFNYDGNNYFASIFIIDDNLNPSPIGTLNDTQCDSLGLSSGCQGFWTEEGQATTVQFGFSVTAVPTEVPEPSAIMLFGMSLLGMFGLARRRMK